MLLHGKVFASILLQRLKRIAQSGYRASRSTIDGILTLRQLMEKAGEQRRNMYIAFVDFTKTFDSVNRDLHLTPTLYGIYAAILLLLAYKTIVHQFSVKILFRYDGNLFNLKRNGKTESSHGLYQGSAIRRRYCHLQRLFSRPADDVYSIQ